MTWNHPRLDCSPRSAADRSFRTPQAAFAAVSSISEVCRLARAPEADCPSPSTSASRRRKGRNYGGVTSWVAVNSGPVACRVATSAGPASLLQHRVQLST